MSKFDPAAFGRFVGRETKRMIREAIAPVERDLQSAKSTMESGFSERIKAIEERQAQLLDMHAVVKSIREEIERELTLRSWKPVADILKSSVSSYIQENPIPCGKDGKDGVDGVDGAAGKDGENGRDGPEGRRGEKGDDGVGLAGAMIDRDGALQITLTNGEVKNLGPVVGKNGEDGKDGLSLDSFEMEYLVESHEISIKAAAAGRTKELRFPAGGIHPAGYWREGTKAHAGEAWVHDGSLWIAMKGTSTKPATGIDDWIIAARKGRDGERGPKGGDLTPPAPIKLG